MSEPARRGAVWTEDECVTSATGAGARRAQTHRGPAGERRGGPGAGARPRTSGHSPLRLVADDGRLIAHASGQRAGAGQDPVRTPAAARPHPPAAPHPLRLTRRGRIVVTAAAVLAIGAASMALAGAAQAIGHAGSGARAGSGAPAAALGAPGSPGSGVTKVVIRPGQSMWSVAEAYDPNADTRQVIQQILQLNSLTSDQVQPGQALWVPRG